MILEFLDFKVMSGEQGAKSTPGTSYILSLLHPAIHSGVRFSYFVICRRKYWLFSHNINFEEGYESVEIGKHIHESSYPNRKHEIELGPGMKVDFMLTRNGVVLHEVKKTPRMEHAHQMQMLYYLWYLHARGVISAKGVIDYPDQRRRVEVVLGEKEKKEIEEMITEMELVYKGACPPPKRSGICKKCAYEEYCFCAER